MDVIAITGGIGSGKSVVSAILRAMGYYVYDSDKEAKRIMHTNASVTALIKTEFGVESYCGESLNRPYLAGIVFGNDAKGVQRKPKKQSFWKLQFWRKAEWTSM